MDTKIDLRLLLGFVIAVSPALGYGLAYVHELGYCNFYNIPAQLIKLDWTTILVAVAASLGALLFLLWIITLIIFLARDISRTRQKIYLAGIVFVGFFIFALRYLTIQESKELVIMYAVFLFFIFAVPWLSSKWPWVRLNRAKTVEETKEGPIHRLINNKYFIYALLTFYLLAFVFLCSNLAGRSDAMNQQIFYVPSSNPQSVVLRIYGDNIICGELVQDQNMYGLGPTIFMLRLGDNSNLSLTPHKVKLSFIQYPK